MTYAYILCTTTRSKRLIYMYSNKLQNLFIILPKLLVHKTKYLLFQFSYLTFDPHSISQLRVVFLFQLLQFIL